MGKVDQGVFALWVARHVYRKPLKYIGKYIGYGGTSKQVRDLLHIHDLIDLLEPQLSKLAQLSGEVFNAGSGRDVSLSLLDMIQICQELTGQQIETTAEAENRPGDILITSQIISQRVHAATGWQPSHSAYQTLEDLYNWIRNNQTSLAKIF